MTLLARPSDLIYRPASADGRLPAALLDATGKPWGGSPLPATLEVRLWGIEGPLLQELRRSPLLRGVELLLPELTPGYLRLSHRRAATELLSYLIESEGYPRELLPLWVEATEDRGATRERLQHAVEEVKARDFGAQGQLLLKRPYSSSGRGVLPLPLPVQEKHLEALAGNCQRLGSVSLEPFLTVLDNWAIEYYRDETGAVNFYALSHFETLASGRAYAGNVLAPSEELWQELAEQVGAEKLERLIALQKQWLEEELRDSLYIGYIGIDLFLYEVEGKRCLHPAVEINLRTTMGILAHEASLRYLPPRARGRFQLDYRLGLSPAFVAHVSIEGKEILL